jgi:hypothetical protein
MPATHSCCLIVDAKRIHGCQFLDFLSNFRSGVPTISEMFERMLLRVRVVFLKQCLAWAIHGELDDPGKEFFVQEKAAAPSASKEFVEKGLPRFDRSSDSKAFDWTTTYTLRLAVLPETHMSPRMATKVLLCGKAVQMLRQTMMELQKRDSMSGGYKNTSGSESHGMFSAVGSDAELQSVYAYLSSMGGTDVTDAIGDDNQELRSFTSDAMSESDVFISDELNNSKVFLDKLLRKHAFRSGYTPEEMSKYSKQFDTIISGDPTNFIHLFEGVIDNINDTISNRLWLLLKDQFGFIRFLISLRNTYLLGKGELFQAFMDGILGLIDDGTNVDSKADAALHWDVVRSAAKLLNLDDDSLCEVIRLKINNSSISVVDFSSDEIRLRGYHHLLEQISGTRFRGIVLGKSNSAFQRETKVNKIAAVLAGVTSKTRESDHMTASAPANPAITSIEAEAPSYLFGCASVEDQKYVLKGFNTTILFSCDWTGVTQYLTPNHRWFRDNDTMPISAMESLMRKDEVASASFDQILPLGSLSCVIHDSPIGDHVEATNTKMVYTSSSPYGISSIGGIGRSISVGVIVSGSMPFIYSFIQIKIYYYTCLLMTARSVDGRIQYFAKVFVAGASSTSLGPGSSSSVASGITSTPKPRRLGAGGFERIML